MLAEIITIGDEILIGQIVDTNSAWIAENFGKLGIRINQITSVSDSEEHITNALNEALARVQLVIITGGLGPTNDDITKLTLAKFFNSPLVIDQNVYSQVEQMMSKRGIKFNALNKSQALVPEACEVIPNINGTAPGMWFKRDDKVVISLPGVPFEMKYIIENEVIQRITKHFSLKEIVHKTIITFGMAESSMAETIASWETGLPKWLHLAYLPSPMSLKLRLSAYNVDQEEATEEIDRQIATLNEIIPKNIVGFAPETLESAVATALCQKGETLATAESCTGGNIAHRFTAQAGASKYFVGGVVAYSNDVKISTLGVDPITLNKFGAVSEVVALQMAEGVKQLTGATYSIATTGIAGPDGGSNAKPVGTVWIAISTPTGSFAKKLVFGSLRDQNIERSSSWAINLLRLHLKKSVNH